MDGLVVVKFISMFLAVWLTILNTLKAYSKENVKGWMFILQALGIVTFLFIQFKMYL